MIKRKQIVQLSLFFLLLHPFYLYILNTFKIYQMPLTIIAILLLVLLTKLKIHKKLITLILPWVIFFVYMALNNIGKINDLLFYFIMIIIMLLLSMNNGWQKEVIKLITIMLLPHVLFTLIFFFVPNLYVRVRPIIAARNIMFEGYRTALTGHYSTNAIYISISVLIFGSVFFQKKMKEIEKKYVFLFLISIMAILLTTKRGPLIFSLASVFITYILVDKKRFSNRFIKVLFSLMILFVMFYLVANYIPALAGAFARFSEDGDSGRSVMYLLAIKMFLMNPLMGRGTGAYKIQYYYYLAKDADHMYLNTHNVYLQLLAENGIIGLVMFLFAAILTLIISIKLLQEFHIKNNSNECVMYISVAFQVYFLLYCLTGNPLYDSMMYMPYFIFCAISYSFYMRRNYER